MIFSKKGISCNMNFNTMCCIKSYPIFKWKIKFVGFERAFIYLLPKWLIIFSLVTLFYLYITIIFNRYIKIDYILIDV